MKTFKTFIILSIFFCSFTIFSQTNEEGLSSPTGKGMFILGGNFSFGFSTSTSEFKGDSESIQNSEIKSISLGLGPRVGYFVIDNLAIGGRVGFSTSKTEIDVTNSETTGTSFSFSPFVRYYFAEGTIKPFLEGTIGVGFSNSNTENDFEDSESKNSLFNYGLDGGIAFFFKKSISLDVGVGYSYNSNKPRNSENDRKFVNSSFFFTTGINVFF